MKEWKLVLSELLSIKVGFRFFKQPVGEKPIMV